MECVRDLVKRSLVNHVFIFSFVILKVLFVLLYEISRILCCMLLSSSILRYVFQKESDSQCVVNDTINGI